MWDCQAFCPRCQTLRTMRISVGRRSEPDAKGFTSEILTRIYHCDNCLAFVRSEDILTEITTEEKSNDNTAR